MKATLLTYNLTGDRLNHLRFLCLRLGIAVRPVPAEAWGLSLSALPGPAIPAADLPTPTGTFTDEMLVMCGFTGPLVNGLLNAMRQARMAPIALKAVLTPSNATWDSVYLHAQLLQEHVAMQLGKPAVHAPQP